MAIDHDWGFEFDDHGFPTREPPHTGHGGDDLTAVQRILVEQLIADGIVLTQARTAAMGGNGAFSLGHLSRAYDLALDRAPDQTVKAGIRLRYWRLLWVAKQMGIV